MPAVQPRVDLQRPAEPTVAVTRAWTTRFSLVWLGLWMANLGPIQLVIPNQLDAIDHAHKVRDFGLISGLTGIAALVTLPLFGALCDRSRSRLGPRKVWIAAGVAVYAAGLLATGAQDTALGLGLAWLVATLGMNMASAALTAVIADSVPESQRGYISAAIYGPQAIGIVVGLGVITALDNNGMWAYGFLALAVVALAVPFLRRYADIHSGGGHRLSVRSVLATMWIDPRRHPDFAWAFGGRLLVNLGNALATTYLLYFLQDDLKVADPDTTLLEVTVVYLVFTLAATYLAGAASDRLARRRPFVAIASTLQAIAGIGLALSPGLPQTFVAAAILGAGYGAYMAVDQALITAVLPDAESRAKDLGIMNVGSVGPQALAPLASSLVIDRLGGYSVLFAVAGVVTVLGTVLVFQIRSVR